MERYKQLKPLYENNHINGFDITERKISNNDSNLSVGLANISAKIGDIEFNKNKIVELNVRIEKLEELIDRKPSYNEIIEETKLEDLFDQMLKKRIYRKEEEVLESAVQARALVQTMGKG